MMTFCEYLTYILIICITIFMIMNDSKFLQPGQTRHWSGAIQDHHGEIQQMDTFMELVGMGGNPIYWL
jgi:hypothetical protein